MPEIERQILTIKERVRSGYHRLLFVHRQSRKVTVPRVIPRHLVTHVVFMMNNFPSDTGLKTTISPQTLLMGIKLDAKHQCRMPFGDYAQLGEEKEPKNDVTEPRTIGGISLGPIGNEQGGYKFMRLVTRNVLKRCTFTPLPMTEDVIERVIHIGDTEGAPEDLELTDRDGNIHQSGEWDDDYIIDDAEAHEDEDEYLESQAAINLEPEYISDSENESDEDDQSDDSSNEIDTYSNDDDDDDIDGAATSRTIKEDETELLDTITKEISEALENEIREINDIDQKIETVEDRLNTTEMSENIDVIPPPDFDIESDESEDEKEDNVTITRSGRVSRRHR